MFQPPVSPSSCLCPCHLCSKRLDTLQNWSFVPWCQHLRWRGRSFLSPTTAAPVSAGTSRAPFPTSQDSLLSFLPPAVTKDPPASLSFTLIWIGGRNPSSREGYCGLSFTASPFQELLLNSSGPSNKFETFMWWDRKNSVLVLLFPHFPLLLAFQDDFSGTKPCNTATLKWHASLSPASTGQLSVVSQKVQFFQDI